MRRKIAEIRLLPPLAIARLGSSPYPLVNYELKTPNDTGPRRIVPAPTIRVTRTTGHAELKTPKLPIEFRDPAGRIRPVAPFLELWMRFEGEQNLQPFTIDTLRSLRLSPASIRWRGHVENLKILRRTGDEKDRIKAETRPFSDHKVHELRGKCPNFLKGKSVPLGSLQYIVPSAELSGIRLRFTPAGGHVYGPPPSKADKDPLIKAAVYDGQKGSWKRYSEPTDTSQAPNQGRFLTSPPLIFAGETLDAGQPKQRLRSWGYFDDECDGIVEAELRLGSHSLFAFARIVAGPPTFAPDSLPIRSVADELEQAMWGPNVDKATLLEAAEIVRCALETVRLMNTAEMNQEGMARADTDIVKRALEPIFEPSVADSVAIRARHERILLALESGSLAWFARMLRHYDEVADFSTLGRRKMPGLMRGADGMHMALTRRQVSKIQKAAKSY
jgi:hypothetical protein